MKYLIRLGYDNIAGILNGGIAAWYIKALQIYNFNLISVHDLKIKLDKGEKIVILDVRDKRKWDKGHINGAKHIYVGHLEEKLDEVPKDWPIIVYCGTARSASLAASILKNNGYGKVYDVRGGMTA